MRTLAKVGIGCGAVAAVASVGLAVVGPTLVREVSRFAAPIQRMRGKQAALDAMVEKAAWKRPERDTLSAGRLDTFLALRKRIDQAVRGAEGAFDSLPRRRVRGLEELKHVPDALEGVSGVVGAEVDAFVAEGMTPAEYHWIERLVYTRWRSALRRAGTYPAAVRAAAVEVEAAARREKPGPLRSRLERLAQEMRARVPDPPEGIDLATHQALLARVDDVERYSMDDVARAAMPMPR